MLIYQLSINYIQSTDLTTELGDYLRREQSYFS